MITHCEHDYDYYFKYENLHWRTVFFSKLIPWLIPCPNKKVEAKCSTSPDSPLCGLKSNVSIDRQEQQEYYTEKRRF